MAQARRSFILATASAGAIWAASVFFLGRLGGKAFEGKPWAGFLLAFGVALAASAVIQILRRARSSRRPSGAGSQDRHDPDSPTTPR